MRKSILLTANLTNFQKKGERYDKIVVEDSGVLYGGKLDLLSAGDSFFGQMDAGDSAGRLYYHGQHPVADHDGGSVCGGGLRGRPALFPENDPPGALLFRLRFGGAERGHGSAFIPGPDSLHFFLHSLE